MSLLVDFLSASRGHWEQKMLERVLFWVSEAPSACRAARMMFVDTIKESLLEHEDSEKYKISFQKGATTETLVWTTEGAVRKAQSKLVVCVERSSRAHRSLRGNAFRLKDMNLDHLSSVVSEIKRMKENCLHLKWCNPESDHRMARRRSN